MTRAAAKPEPMPHHEPTASERLHVLARAVERLGVSGRTDPETVLIAKMTIAGALRAIAAEMRP